MKDERGLSTDVWLHRAQWGESGIEASPSWIGIDDDPLAQPGSLVRAAARAKVAPREQDVAVNGSRESGRSEIAQKLDSRFAGAVETSGEKFSFGSREVRILGAYVVFLSAAVALGFAFLPHPRGQTICLLMASFGLASFGFGWLSGAYELLISPTGIVTWTSVLRTVVFPLSDIIGMVRGERVSNGDLASIRIEYV